MAKKTLLEIVQDILNDMDADSVNSINDTIEAEQVANIVRSTFEGMVSNRNWPHMKKLVQLDSANDVDKPNYLKLPINLIELSQLRYEAQKFGAPVSVRELQYKTPEQFLEITSSRPSDGDNIQVVTDFNGAKLFIVTNAAPTFWTSFDDVYIVTDSYDLGIDTTLQKSKSQALAVIEPAFVMQDDFIADLPTDAFTALIEEAKSTAFMSLKQMVNQKSEQKAQRHNRWLARKAWRAHGGVQYPDYGRKNRK